MPIADEVCAETIVIAVSIDRAVLLPRPETTSIVYGMQNRAVQGLWTWHAAGEALRFKASVPPCLQAYSPQRQGETAQA